LTLTASAAQPARHAADTIAAATRLPMDASLFVEPGSPVDTPFDAINHRQFPCLTDPQTAPLTKTFYYDFF
jgi:hypothetical protein